MIGVENRLLEVEEVETFWCDQCQDTGVIEVMGGTDYDEWTVVGIRRCSCFDD